MTNSSTSATLYNTDIARSTDAAIQAPSGTVSVVDGGTNPTGSNNPVDWLSQPKGKSFLIRPFIGDDTTDTEGQGEDFAAPSARHLETANVLYADGHVKSQRVDKFYDVTVNWPNRMPCLDPNTGCG